MTDLDAFNAEDAMCRTTDTSLTLNLSRSLLRSVCLSATVSEYVR